MSYILDALKKSEQERAQGSVPDIKTIHAPPVVSQPQQNNLTWVIIILLSMALAAGIVFAWRHYVQVPSPFAQTNTTPTQASAQPSTVQPSTATEAESKGTSSFKSHTAIGTTPSHSVTKTSKKPQEAKNHTKAPPRAKVVFLKNEIPDDQLYSEEPYHPEKKSAADTKQQKRSSKAASSSSHTPAPAAEQPDIVDITELSADIRKRLPEINFSGHVYSTVKSRRSVIINGKYMREGEYLNPDLKLEKITSKGVVFSMGDVWFRLAAMQDWSNR